MHYNVYGISPRECWEGGGRSECNIREKDLYHIGTMFFHSHSLKIAAYWKRIQACCSIDAVCTNSFLDHTATRRWTTFKSPGRLCTDAIVPGGHSWTANWRIHFRQLKGNTFQSRNLSTNKDLDSSHGNRKNVINKERSHHKQKQNLCIFFT